MRLHRLISILLLIEKSNTTGIKAKELAKRLEVSQRTVYRDIDTLCEAGIPIITETGPSGGIRLMDGYSGGIHRLTEEDIMNLFIGGLGIQPDRGSEMSLKINNALMKLQKNLPMDQETALNNIEGRFWFDSSPWWGEAVASPYVDLLIHSIVKNIRIHITYQNMDGSLTLRDVDPYGLVVKHADWYLVGYCHKSKSMRLFKCERFKECIQREETFSMPTNFSIASFWTEHKTSFKHLCAEHEIYPVTVQLQYSHLDLIKDLERYSLEMLKDGNGHDTSMVLATVNMFQPEFAFETAMRNINYLEVIHPSELRLQIVSELKRITHLYT